MFVARAYTEHLDEAEENV